MQKPRLKTGVFCCASDHSAITGPCLRGEDRRGLLGTREGKAVPDAGAGPADGAPVRRAGPHVGMPLVARNNSLAGLLEARCEDTGTSASIRGDRRALARVAGPE